MTLIISSDARWATAAGPIWPTPSAPSAPYASNPRAMPTPPATLAPTDHRLRRRLGRKCATVLAGASMGLGLAAARIPAASAAQAGLAQPAPAGHCDRPTGVPPTPADQQTRCQPPGIGTP
jgi:hypothetical protein